MATDEELQATDADTATEEKTKLSLDVKIETKSSCERHIVVTVSRDDINRYVDKAYGELMPKALVPGFRAGRAPRKLVESFGVAFPSADPAAVPQLSDTYESNVPGLYIIGALGGYPLIKQAMNQGYEVVEYIQGNKVEPADEDLLKEAQGLIVALEPKPGRQFARAEANIIVPDVIVQKSGRGWKVVLNADVMPKLRINDMYAQALRASRSPRCIGTPGRTPRRRSGSTSSSGGRMQRESMRTR